MLPETEICCHGQCGSGQSCPLHDTSSQKVVMLHRATLISAPAEVADDGLEAVGPPATSGNSLGSLWADVRGFWAALPALTRMRFTRPWFVREVKPARRKSDAHPDNVVYPNHFEWHLKSQEMIERLQGQKEGK